MKTIVIAALGFAIVGAILTPLIAVMLMLPVFYSRSSEPPETPGLMIPLVIVATPGLAVAWALFAVGIPIGIAPFVVGGLIGHGALGAGAGGVIVAIRRRSRGR